MRMMKQEPTRYCNGSLLSYLKCLYASRLAGVLGSRISRLFLDSSEASPPDVFSSPPSTELRIVPSRRPIASARGDIVTTTESFGGRSDVLRLVVSRLKTTIGAPPILSVAFWLSSILTGRPGYEYVTRTEIEDTVPR